VQGTLCPSSVNTPQSSPCLKHVPARRTEAGVSFARPRCVSALMVISRGGSCHAGTPLLDLPMAGAESPLLADPHAVHLFAYGIFNLIASGVKLDSEKLVTH